MSYLLLALLASLPFVLPENASAEDGAPAPAPASRASVSVNAQLEAEVSGAAASAPSPESAILKALETSTGLGSPAASARKDPSAAPASPPVPKATPVAEEPLVRPVGEAAAVDQPAVNGANNAEAAKAGVANAPDASGSVAIPPTGNRPSLPPAPPVASADTPAVLPGVVATGSVGYQAAPPLAPAPQAADQQAGKRSNEIEVSDTDYNRFVFPHPAVQVVSPVGPPVVSEPLYMDGNRTALIRFSSYRWPIQLVFELEDGSVHEVLAKPAPIRGITKRIGGEDRRLREAARAESNAATEAAQAASGFAAAGDIELLEDFVIGNIPGNFEEWEELPPEVHFERFWAKPINVWTDGATTRVEAWRLIGRPGLAASIAPPQFYRPGVRAVQLEHDIVDGKTHPLMLIVLDDFQD